MGAYAHTPLTQLCPSAHGVAHAPQLRGSLSVLAQYGAAALWVAQTSNEQKAPLGLLQTDPTPQHTVGVALRQLTEHPASSHRWPDGQLLPQAPQFSRSISGLLHPPSHAK